MSAGDHVDKVYRLELNEFIERLLLLKSCYLKELEKWSRSIRKLSFAPAFLSGR